MFGALDEATGQEPWQLNLRQDSHAFVAFLEPWQHTWPEEKLVVVLGHVGDPKRRQTLA